METEIQTDQKLAAIMFTDIISYTKMMSKNENKTLSLLKEHNLLLNEEFTKHDGNVIKETGDGYLASFSSSLKSVKAAIAIQNSLHLYNSTQDTDDQINEFCMAIAALTDFKELKNVVKKPWFCQNVVNIRDRQSQGWV